MILLSIIIPVYNLENYIVKCLDSIYEQGVDEETYEVIAVDDGSKDRSLSILREYATLHSNLKVIHQENAGVSVARNRALDEAEADYVTFVDGDDMVAAGSIQKLNDLIIDSNSNFDVCYCRTFHVMSEGALWESHLWQKDFHPNERYRGKDILMKHYNNCGSVCGGIYKVNFLDKINLRFIEGISNGEDTVFNYFLYVENPVIIFVDIQLNLVIDRIGSASRSHSMDRVNKFGSSISSLKHLEKTKNYSAVQQQALDASYYHIISLAVNMYIEQGGNDYKKIRDLLAIKELHNLSVTWLPQNQRNKIMLLNSSFWLYYISLRLKHKLNLIRKNSSKVKE